MLIKFNVQNYRSIKDECELSMVASRYYKEYEENNTFDTGIPDFPRLLKSVVIYGPNGTGKSTIMDAMKFLERFILNSAKNSQAEEKIDVSPFRLCSIARSEPSNFEISFIEDGTRYEYGLSVTTEKVLEEWLIAYPKGSPQKWFHRVWDQDSEDYAYKFSKSFAGGRLRQDWQRHTRPNSSFFSVAIQFNNEQLKPAFSWFQKRVAIMKPENLSSEFTAEECKDTDFKRKVIEFITSADIAVDDIQIKSRKFSDVDFPDNMPQSFREEIKKTFKDKEFHEVFFFRPDDTGAAVAFAFSEESNGTQGLFNFAGPWIDVTSHDLVLLVDELDSSLHPLIVHHLVDILHKQSSKAQIIFTTHDTTILSQKILRRDQIWLLKKNRKFASTLYPLSDFKIREGESVEKGYLSGRYGGIPFIRDVKFDGE